MTLQLKSDGRFAPGRNDPCPCESGLKYKHCHGDQLKIAVCNRVANEKMCQLIMDEKRRKGLLPMRYTCSVCGKGFEGLNHSNIVDKDVTPCCSSVDFKENSNG